MEKYELAFIAPIPVGHRVEVTTYERPKGGFFSMEVDLSDKPVVRDMETGVVYGSSFLYTEKEGIFPTGAGKDVLSALPNERYTPVAQIVGKVVDCRVLTNQPFGRWVSDRRTTHVQTTLVIEPE